MPLLARVRPTSPEATVHLLSLSFFLIFFAYSAAQNYQTTGDARVGSFALGLVYTTFMIGGLASPLLVSLIGTRVSLIAASSTYVLFVATNALGGRENEALTYVASVLLGFGAAMLWNANGLVVTRAARASERIAGLPRFSQSGSMSSRFFSLFALNVSLGSATVAVLFEVDLPKATVFTVLTVVCALGAALLLLLPRPGDAGHNPEDDEAERDASHESVLRRAVSAASLWPDTHFLWLLPLIIYVGLTRAFVSGDVPVLIDSNAWKFWMFSAYGTARAVGPLASGRLSDRVGRAKAIVAGVSLHVTAYGWLLIDVPSSDEHLLFCLLGALYGLGDGVLDAQMYATIGSLFQVSRRTSIAFANLNMFNSLATAFSFFSRNYVSLHAKMMTVLVTLGVAMFGLTLLVASGALQVATAGATSVTNDAGGGDGGGDGDGVDGAGDGNGGSGGEHSPSGADHIRRGGGELHEAAAASAVSTALPTPQRKRRVRSLRGGSVDGSLSDHLEVEDDYDYDLSAPPPVYGTTLTVPGAARGGHEGHARRSLDEATPVPDIGLMIRLDAPAPHLAALERLDDELDARREGAERARASPPPSPTLSSRRG